MAINQAEKLGNKYTLLDLIGTGGMAQVFKGKLSGAEGFEKLVVLKKLLAQFAHDSEIVAHFISEAKLAALLQHENIAQIYDFGELDGSYFIAMEYLFGKDLQSVLLRARELNYPMGVEQALYIAAKICEGMEYAHSLRDFQQQPLHIIHRDLSPHNIFITYDGRVKIIDFGIARAELFDNKTQVGVAKGKLSYMSPEQLASERIDKRSDIFAIGILLYEMLSGKRMYSGDTATMIRKCMQVEYDKLQFVCPGLHPAIYETLDKALQKDVGRRYQSCAHMQADVEESLFNINKRPSAQLLERYLGLLFAGELTAERTSISRSLAPACDATGRTVLVPSSTSRTIAAKDSPATEQNTEEATKLATLTDRLAQSADGIIEGQPRQRSRKVKAELSSLSAQTKLMPLRYKAELSSLPAQTKLMPLRFKPVLAGSICIILVVIFAVVWKLGSDWDIGEPEAPPVRQTASAPSKELPPPEVLPEPATHPEPEPGPAPGSPDMTQKLLLDQAEEILSKNKPEPYELETARKLYHHVQEIDPNNKEARAGIDRIREHLRASTEEALKAGNFSQATNHMSKGMFQAPKDDRFSSLQESFVGKRQKIITDLAEKAEEAMQSNHLIAPTDDNAYQFYNEILELDPQNTVAQNGITRLADRYLDLAVEAYRNVQIPSAQDYVRQGLTINPHHKQLLELQRNLTVAELTEKAEEALQNNHLTTPPKDNAFHYYSEILELDPQNAVAQKNITQLADRYALLAEDAYRNRRIPSAREYVRQGLAISPNHTQLLELQKDLTKSKPGIFFKSVEKSFRTMFQ